VIDTTDMTKEMTCVAAFYGIRLSHLELWKNKTSFTKIKIKISLFET